MSINWNVLENNINNYLKSSKQLSTNDIAENLSKMYMNTILKEAMDPNSNKIMSINNGPLSKSLKLSLDASIRTSTGNPSTVNSFGLSGIVQMWLNVVMGTVVPPKGAISVVSNKIVFAGSIIQMNIDKNTKFIEKDFAKEFIVASKKHLSMVTGVCIALIPAVPAPIPMPFNWKGIL